MGTQPPAERVLLINNQPEYGWLKTYRPSANHFAKIARMYSPQVYIFFFSFQLSKVCFLFINWKMFTLLFPVKCTS